jgi:beta-glucosidase
MTTGDRLSDMEWGIYPKGLYDVCIEAKVMFKKPIYIFENGLADAKDNYRSDFIREHLEFLSKALVDCADVKGYFYWSLTDNFEWNKGFDPRFGLVEIDYRTLERKPRPSFYAYKKIIENNGIE